MQYFPLNLLVVSKAMMIGDGSFHDQIFGALHQSLYHDS